MGKIAFKSGQVAVLDAGLVMGPGPGPSSQGKSLGSPMGSRNHGTEVPRDNRTAGPRDHERLQSEIS